MNNTCKVKFTDTNGNIEEKDYAIGDSICIGTESIPADTESAELFLNDFCAEAEDDGFYVIPNPHMHTNRNTAQAFFRERPDCESVFGNPNMPIFAISRNGKAVLAVVTGMNFDYVVVVGVKDGKYYLRPRFNLNGKPPYENLEIKFFELDGDDVSYSALARRYRQFQLERGACIPLRERMKRHPVLKETAKGPMVRLRMAWKPVPPPVLEQTEENEPPIHVAITFERAEEIIEEFHRQGIEHAEFCLVGWNKSGHDGRFPDIFPVEPLLGGEEGLLKVIEKAKSYGYLISAHTEVTGFYTIAKRWCADDIILDENGEMLKGSVWGGGQVYRPCPKQAHENYLIEDMDDMERLGFHGTHYLDVMTIIPPHTCNNPLHPLNKREAGEWRGKSMALSREKVGASSSEGSYDFCIGDVDYVLYSVFERTEKLPEICDCYIPFWHIAYHGIVLYNAFTDSVNAMIKNDKTLGLNNYEYGGRPLAYFYAKFLSSGSNWMGDEDIVCDTDENMQRGVKAIKADYDLYQQIVDLQFEFMEEHKKVNDEMSVITYSNGTSLIVNRSADEAEYQGKKIAPYSFARL